MTDNNESHACEFLCLKSGGRSQYSLVQTSKQRMGIFTRKGAALLSNRKRRWS